MRTHLSRRGVPRARATAFAIGALAVALVGCGADEPGGGDVASSDEVADDEPTGDAVVVAIEDADDFVFAPDEVSVAVGDTVTWQHDGRIAHTVTAEDDSFDSGSLSAGDTFEVTFDEAGTFAYVCQFHGGMTGTVTVS